jgi:hypothetical protein
MQTASGPGTSVGRFTVAFDGSDFEAYLHYAIACMTLALAILEGYWLPNAF